MKPIMVPTAPRFVRALNSVAEAAGFTTDVHIGEIWAHDAGPYLISTWRGSREAFSRLNFLPASERVRIHTPGGKFSWPCGATPLLYGTVGFFAEAVEFRFQETIPKAVRVIGELEEIQYDDLIAYHGTREALIAAGVCSSAQFPQKHMLKRCNENWGAAARKVQWGTQRQLDGLYVHWVETAETRRRRIEKLGEHELRVALQNAETQRACDNRRPEDRPTMRALVARAEGDSAFQTFLGRLLQPGGGTP